MRYNDFNDKNRHFFGKKTDFEIHVGQASLLFFPPS